MDIGRLAMTKSMWRIVPLILLAYLMAYMDRVNISFASLQMNDDLKFSASIYGLGAGLFFLAYALFEVPSSLMLRRYSAPQWIARIMITWGLLSAGMMFVRSPLQFYVMRFLLGAAEAGFFPSVIYYFSSWFPTAWRGRAVSRIYIASSLASVVMGGARSRPDRRTCPTRPSRRFRQSDGASVRHHRPAPECIGYRTRTFCARGAVHAGGPRYSIHWASGGRLRHPRYHRRSIRRLEFRPPR